MDITRQTIAIHQPINEQLFIRCWSLSLLVVGSIWLHSYSVQGESFFLMQLNWGHLFYPDVSSRLIYGHILLKCPLIYIHLYNIHWNIRCSQWDKRWTLMSWLATIADAQSPTASAKNMRLNKENETNTSIYYQFILFIITVSHIHWASQHMAVCFFFSCYKFIIRLIVQRLNAHIFAMFLLFHLLLLTKMDDVWLSLLVRTFFLLFSLIFQRGKKSIE